MVDILLANDELTVLGGPESINVELDFGPDGERGSKIFVGNGKPTVITLLQTPKVYDLYINLLTTDDEYLMIYQYQEPLGSGSPQWETLTKLLPNTFTGNQSVNFSTQNFCKIPTASIVDPSYVGSVTAANFSIQATIQSTNDRPIATSIKPEITTDSGIENLKITFYAKEFDGLDWTDIVGSRTVHLHISVV